MFLDASKHKYKHGGFDFRLETLPHEIFAGLSKLRFLVIDFKQSGFLDDVLFGQNGFRMSCIFLLWGVLKLLDNPFQPPLTRSAIVFTWFSHGFGFALIDPRSWLQEASCFQRALEGQDVAARPWGGNLWILEIGWKLKRSHDCEIWRIPVTT